MSAASCVALRRMIGPFRPVSVPYQRRWARVHDVRFVTTHQGQERVTERYREKLEQKAKEEGHASVSSMKEAYRDRIQEYQRKANAPSPTESRTAAPSPFPPPPPPPPTAQSSSTEPQQQRQAQPQSPGSPSSNPTGIKPLSSYLDLDKVAGLPQKEVEYIWRLRHANDARSLCAVIPLETYQRIYSTARQHPQFVLPIPRPETDDATDEMKPVPPGIDGGNRTAADIHFLQWGFHPPAPAPGPAAATAPAESKAKSANSHTSTVLFTQLAAFKLHGTYAQPHTTITHHLDLADSHGLVLLNGSVVDGRGVSVEEGRWLLMCLQKFYDADGHGGGAGREKRRGLLQQFSAGDQGFNLEDLVEEAERIS